VTPELRSGTEVSVPLSHAPPAPVTFNLNWGSGGDTPDATDLDIGCLYRCVNPKAAVGAVQAVRPAGLRPALGTSTGKPVQPRNDVAALDADDRDGRTRAGETLTLLDPGKLDFAIVFASIYQGVSDFSRVGATLTISFGGEDLALMRLANPDSGLRWCAMVACGKHGDRFVMVSEERYFLSGLHADRHYGFGLNWVVGHKVAGTV
jgi:tellurite resistance protein TerA